MTWKWLSIDIRIQNASCMRPTYLPKLKSNQVYWTEHDERKKEAFSVCIVVDVSLKWMHRTRQQQAAKWGIHIAANWKRRIKRESLAHFDRYTYIVCKSRCYPSFDCQCSWYSFFFFSPRHPNLSIDDREWTRYTHRLFSNCCETNNIHAVNSHVPK